MNLPNIYNTVWKIPKYISIIVPMYRNVSISTYIYLPTYRYKKVKETCFSIV